MKTSLKEVLALLMLTLIIQKAVEVLDSGVVEFTGLLNHQQVDAGHADRLLAEVVDYDTVIPAEDVDGQFILFLNPWGILCEALAWPVNIVCRKIER